MTEAPNRLCGSLWADVCGFPGGSDTQPRQLTNEEQALEIMGLLDPVDFSPEAVAQREWEKLV